MLAFSQAQAGSGGVTPGGYGVMTSTFAFAIVIFVLLVIILGVVL
ncbi:MAG: hypothetical protein BSOLF_2033 [Candidatus Carbobacillus altaicus]|uniref:Uncharacterized protein n=1 Tax=Candidatus Carbonibacillus altaicus TaxID=2163959 RepID=A0A2R6Y3N3_9BACL|nr:MAG: hypothetical protein BSOLF_2033 [Candidatus Carbobacillus altaicus]